MLAAIASHHLLRQTLSPADRIHSATAAIEAKRYELALGILRGLTGPAENHPSTQYLRALAYLGLGKAVEAESAARSALMRGDPLSRTRDQAAYVLGASLVGQGRFSEGWPLFEAWRKFALQSHHELLEHEAPDREWSGQDLAGKHILVVMEQGRGDIIQFARFVPSLRALGAKVTLVCPDVGVAPILCDLADGVICGSGSVHDYHYWTRSMSLPLRLGVTLESLPSAPYIAWPESKTPDGAKVGFMSAGNPAHTNDQHRSMPPEDAERLARAIGAISLAPEDTGARDFLDTAAIIAGLDLVVTVDTSVAHLAGAMGKAVWIMLSAHSVDWRWQCRPTDSPWYPSAKLYRQRAPGAWGEVIDRIQVDLAAEGASHGPRSTAPGGSHLVELLV